MCLAKMKFQAYALSLLHQRQSFISTRVYITNALVHLCTCRQLLYTAVVSLLSADEIINEKITNKTLGNLVRRLAMAINSSRKQIVGTKYRYLVYMQEATKSTRSHRLVTYELMSPESSMAFQERLD
jgi:hypothetical protein